MSARGQALGSRQRDTIYIGGQWVASTGTRRDIVSPATVEVIGYAPDGTAADMDRAVTAARKTF